MDGSLGVASGLYSMYGKNGHVTRVRVVNIPVTPEGLAPPTRRDTHGRLEYRGERGGIAMTTGGAEP